MTTSTCRQEHCRLTSSRFPIRNKYSFRPGLTLVEILIALTMTLIVLGAMAQAFKFASGEIAEGRAILELANRLRNAEQLLRRDLAGITVEVRPHTENTPNGYFEFIEGPNIDSSAIGSGNGYLGDPDDMLAFTTRSLDGEFRGRFNGQVLQGGFAEVIWFTMLGDVNMDDAIDFNESVFLYRRVLLIRPDLNMMLDDGDGNMVSGLFVENSQANVNSRLEDTFTENDISLGVTQLDNGNFLIAANSLEDLGRRERRFARNFATYPHFLSRALLENTRMGAANGLSGDDILLTDIAAFDIQIYSPDTQINTNGNVALNPDDVGYTANVGGRHGGFVDLGVSGANFDLTDANFSRFTSLPEPRSRLRTRFDADNVNLGFDIAYCTWSPHYEIDGRGQNGLDDDGINGVDDDGERRTSPPYPFAPRGIQATFRVVEKNTKQIRQTSVIHNFSKM